jgi:hypothetical protein
LLRRRAFELLHVEAAVHRELLRVLRQHGWTVDGEVNEHLRTHVLAQLDRRLKTLVFGSAGFQGGVLHVLRPHPEDHRTADVGAQRPSVMLCLLVYADPVAPERDAETIIVRALDRGLDEVHGGRTDEARDEEVGRLAVETRGGVDLLKDA